MLIGNVCDQAGSDPPMPMARADSDRLDVPLANEECPENPVVLDRHSNTGGSLGRPNRFAIERQQRGVQESDDLVSLPGPGTPDGHARLTLIAGTTTDQPQDSDFRLIDLTIFRHGSTVDEHGGRLWTQIDRAQDITVRLTVDLDCLWLFTDQVDRDLHTSR